MEALQTNVLSREAGERGLMPSSAKGVQALQVCCDLVPLGSSIRPIATSHLENHGLVFASHEIHSCEGQ